MIPGNLRKRGAKSSSRTFRGNHCNINSVPRKCYIVVIEFALYHVYILKCVQYKLRDRKAYDMPLLFFRRGFL